jgi:hypothetical protein
MLDADGTERLAATVLGARYPGADAGFAMGSILRGEATPFSDLDLVVLFARLPNARREAFFSQGDSAPLIAFTERALAPLGGFLFDGWTRELPPSARRVGARPSD